MSAWKKLLAADDKPPRRTTDDPWVQAAGAQPAGLNEGFDAAHRSRRSASLWMWAKRIAVGMLLVAGFIQLVVKPVRNVLAEDVPPPAAIEQIDLVAAGATAVGFSVDYLSSAGAAWEPHRAAALQQWLYPDAFGQASDVGTWIGDAVLVADSASVQAAEAVADDAAVVAVQARLRTFVSTESSVEAPAPPMPQEQGSPAFIPSVPAGYTAGPAYWVRLAVPVMSTDSGPRVASPGPVFTAEDIAPVAVTVESDARASEKLQPATEKIFTAYAAGDLQYVAAQDSDLVGLDGELNAQSVTALRISSVANKDGSRNAAVDVQWSLAGAPASITQTYGLTVSSIDANAPQLQHISVLQPTGPDES